MLRRTARSGITLMQLLIVLIVLALLIALLLPAIQRVRESASYLRSQNNLKQLGISIHAYHDTFQRLPSSVGRFNEINATFFFGILPFVEQENVYRQKKTDVPILVYQADSRDPSADKTEPLTSYATNFSVLGDGKKPLTLINIRKGTSNTIALMERYAVVGGKDRHLWGDPKPGVTYLEGTQSSVEFDVPPARAKNTTAHGMALQRCAVCLFDGSIRTITPAMKPATFQWACSPDSDKAAPADW